MNTSRILAVTLRQWYLTRGSFTRIMPMFVWVAIDIVLWGFITRYLNGVTESGINFVQIFLGAVLMWGFLVRVMHGTTMAFMEDIWSRNFLNLFASPITVPEYLTGIVLSSIATSAIGLTAMLVLATLVFGLSLFSYGLMLLPFLLVLFLFGIALGILGCTLMMRHGPAAEWFVWPIPALLSPFACVFYPVSVLPQWMQSVAYLVPPSHVFEAMRALVAGHGVSLGEMAASIGLSFAYILLACWLFARVYRYALQTGLIARYTAESVA